MLNLKYDIAKQYLANLKLLGLLLPSVKDRKNHVWHLFVVQHKSTQRVIDYLPANGAQTLIHYPIPPHKQQAYKGYEHLYLPIIENIHEKIFSIPISPTLADADVAALIEVMDHFNNETIVKSINPKIVAIYSGPSGLAMIGQIQSFIIGLNGVVNTTVGNAVFRYTAECVNSADFKACTPWWVASAQWVAFSISLSVVACLVFIDELSLWLFHSSDFLFGKLFNIPSIYVF